MMKCFAYTMSLGQWVVCIETKLDNFGNKGKFASLDKACIVYPYLNFHSKCQHWGSTLTNKIASKVKTKIQATQEVNFNNCQKAKLLRILKHGNQQRNHLEWRLSHVQATLARLLIIMLVIGASRLIGVTLWLLSCVKPSFINESFFFFPFKSFHNWAP